MKVTSRVHGRRNELKINIESMVRCGGSCEGCILTSDERVHGSIWPRSMFERAYPFVRGFIQSHLDSGTHFHEISVTFGQGDHFLLTSEDADFVVRWLSKLAKGRVVGFISASAIGRRDRVFRSVDSWYEAMQRHGQALNVDMVFDPCKMHLDRFVETYAANIAHVRQAFGDVDLNINVGPDTPEATTPERLRDFVIENGFSRLTLNLVPLPGKGRIFADGWQKIIEWFERTLLVWRPEDGYSINFCPAIAPLIEGADSQISERGLLGVADFVGERLEREIYIDGNGAVSHSQAGFGDVPLSRRFGFEPRLTVDVPEESALQQVRDSARAFASRIVGRFVAHEACGECRFRGVCPKIGAIAVASSMRRHLPEDGCPAGIKPLLHAIEGFMREGLDLATECYRDPRVHVPHGFDINLLRNARPARTFSGSLRIDSLRSSNHGVHGHHG